MRYSRMRQDRRTEEPIVLFCEAYIGLRYIVVMFIRILSTYIQCCSPRDHGLGLEAPRGHKLKSWSWSCTHGLGLGLA